jgi:hypothetical protein
MSVIFTFTRFEVLTAVLSKIRVFWDVTPFRVSIVTGVSDDLNAFTVVVNQNILALTLKMKTLKPSKRWYYLPVDTAYHPRRSE